MCAEYNIFIICTGPKLCSVSDFFEFCRGLCLLRTIRSICVCFQLDFELITTTLNLFLVALLFSESEKSQTTAKQQQQRSFLSSLWSFITLTGGIIRKHYTFRVSKMLCDKHISGGGRGGASYWFPVCVWSIASLYGGLCFRLLLLNRSVYN